MNLPQAVLAALDAAIVGQEEEVEEIFDLFLEDIAAEQAADKAAKIARLEVTREA